MAATAASVPGQIVFVCTVLTRISLRSGAFVIAWGIAGGGQLLCASRNVANRTGSAAVAARQTTKQLCEGLGGSVGTHHKSAIPFLVLCLKKVCASATACPLSEQWCVYVCLRTYGRTGVLADVAFISPTDSMVGCGHISLRCMLSCCCMT
jgi:hypothetical protein